MPIDQFSDDRVVDRLRIQDVMYKWCRGVDRLDRAGMLDCFWPGAHDSHGPYIGPIEGLVDWVLERHKPIPFSSHFIGNLLIEFTSPEIALTEAYVRTIQRYPPTAKAQLAQFTGGAAGNEGTSMDIFTSSRYVDRVEKRDGVWKIAERTVIQDWKQLIEVQFDALQPKPGWVIGRRDGDDELHALRRAVGL